jgi:hypothetical protein
MLNTNTKEQKILLQWTAGGEKKDPNAAIWMYFVFLLTGATLIYNLVMGRWMASAVFALLFVVLIWYFFSSSKTVNIVLSNTGIQLDKQFYDFDNIKGYWYSDRNNTFYIEPKKKSGMIVSFPTGNKKIEDIKKNLPDYLTEIEGRGEDVIDRITRLLHM